MAIPPTPPSMPPPAPPHTGPPPMEGGEPMGAAGGAPQGGGNDIAARIAAELPEPTEKGYTPKVLKALADKVEKTWAAMRKILPALPELPPAEALLPADYTGEGKLPASLLVPVVLLLTLAAEMGGDKGVRYAVDLAELVDDRAIKKVVAQLDVLAGDKALAKVLMAQMKEPDNDEKAGDISDGDEDNEVPAGMREPRAMKDRKVGGAMKEPPPIPGGVRMGL